MDHTPETSASLPDERPTTALHPSTDSISRDQHAVEDFSIIENDGTGDNWQIMVSTNNKTIRGTNKGRGWRNRQLGGNLADTSVQQISADMVKIGLQPGESGSHPARNNETSSQNVAREGVRVSEFGNRHGPGFILSDENAQGGREPSSD